MTPDLNFCLVNPCPRRWHRRFARANRSAPAVCQPKRYIFFLDRSKAALDLYHFLTDTNTMVKKLVLVQSRKKLRKKVRRTVFTWLPKSVE